MADKLSAEQYHDYLVRTYRLTPEEAAKWDTSFINKATYYGIPKQYWGNPGVEECIHLLISAEKLQMALSDDLLNPINIGFRQLITHLRYGNREAR